MDRFCPEVSHVAISEEEPNKRKWLGKSVSFKTLGYFQEGINETPSFSSQQGFLWGTCAHISPPRESLRLNEVASCGDSFHPLS